MIKDYLINDGEYIVFNGEYMECYIPQFYLEGKLGEVYGSSIRVFGIFNARLFKNNKPMKLETFNYPSMLMIFPSETETKDLTLVEGDSEPSKYIVAKFYKGSRLMRNSVAKDSSNVEALVRLIIGGKIPTTIPYSQLLDVWLKNLEINEIKLQVASTVLECILTQFYRDAKRPELRFSQTIGKNPSVGDFAYKPANIRELCARNSTFAALTFEDMDSMITSSINISRYNKKEIESPLEKILKM